ncbi:GFA family protein [Paraburkholderia sp. J67]|uniref:GFA family protein n=1 Tax=Paraburkholderia sp. J67 TaxID=2805435 RepID=UPI002ABD1DB3|nr:GFA family protein [Paraburkholderia sp. J67]
MNSKSIESARASLRGQCLCGAVRYRVEDAFRYAFNCHCSQCRRATGAAFKPFAGIEHAHLNLEAGQQALMIYGSPDAAHDVHCGRCGSLLYSVVREGAYVHVTLGTLVDAPAIRPQGHLFVGSKAPWHEITDALPQYDEFPS